jgi:Methionine synthase I, cobalamin-binding domain
MRAPEIRTLELPTQAVPILRAEIFRYLGLRGTAPDARLEEMTGRCAAAFSETVSYRACWTEVPVVPASDGVLLGPVPASGKALARNLSGCGRAILFAATTGLEPERQRRRAAVSSPAEALVLDAVGSAAIEAFCDALCRLWQDERSGFFLRPRFSPGYGDLPLETQRPLLTLLDSARSAGVSLTESLLMVPQKSVSAVVGIGESGCAEKTGNCSRCGKTDCAFRL